MSEPRMYDVRHVRTEREGPFSRVVYDTIAGEPIVFSMLEREADGFDIRLAETVTQITIMHA